MQIDDTAKSSLTGQDGTPYRQASRSVPSKRGDLGDKTGLVPLVSRFVPGKNA